MSVIIPAFNAASTLNTTLESVSRQTYGDWEAIIVDDGSTDFTASNALVWCRNDERFRLIKQKNRGLSGARNAGAESAKAPWLLFLDADDLISADHLESLVSATKRDPAAGLAYCAWAHLSADGRIGKAHMAPTDRQFERLALYNIFSVHACLVSHDLFRQMGGFDTSLRTCEDWDLWQRLARSGASFVPASGGLALYRMRATSLSHRAELLFEGARTVITRGHHRDDRVPQPIPEYVDGVPIGTLSYGIVCFALWCSALLIGAGEEASPFLRKAQLPDHLEFPPDEPKFMPEVSPAAAVGGGVPVGACMLYEDWLALWPRSSRQIYEAYGEIERRYHVPNFAIRFIEELASSLQVSWRGLEEVADQSELEQAAVPPPRRRARPVNGGPPVILMYHRVRTARYDPWQLCVSAENLSEQLNVLSAQRDVVPLPWLSSKLNEGILPRGTACVTFDDGYADVLQNGKSLLEKYECAATLFLPTHYISSDEGFWWDVLARIFFDCPQLPPELKLAIGGVEYVWPLVPASENSRVDMGIVDVHMAVWRLLKPLRPQERRSVLEKLAGWAGTDTALRSSDRTMTSEELARFIQPGFIDVGAHSVTHSSLPLLSDENLQQEVVDSKKACEELSGKAVSVFSYPFGDFDQRAINAVREAGFALACTTLGGELDLNQDRMKTPRLLVGNWDAEHFDRKVLYTRSDH